MGNGSLVSRICKSNVWISNFTLVSSNLFINHLKKNISEMLRNSKVLSLFLLLYSAAAEMMAVSTISNGNVATIALTIVHLAYVGRQQ